MTPLTNLFNGCIFETLYIIIREHILGNKLNLNQDWKLEVKLITFSDHNKITLEINWKIIATPKLFYGKMRKHLLGSKKKIRI